MRLVYVTSSFPFGPGEAFILPELESLLKMGHELLVVPLWPQRRVVHEDAARWLARTSATGLISFETGSRFFREFSKSSHRIGQLSRVFAEAKPFIALKNLAVLPKAAWLAEKATQWRSDHIHAFWASTVATLAMGASELSGIPWSFTAHRFDIVQDNLFKEKARRARFVRFISASGLRMAGLLGTYLEGKVEVLHLGVDLKDRIPIVNNNNPPVALCAAGFVPVKGHAILIDAVDQLRKRGIPLVLWLAGDGELRDDLQLDVQRRGLAERVKFLGALSHKTLLQLYDSGAVDVAVLASTDLGNGLHEGIPASLMEAMSFGVPALGTETGGIPELLAGGAGVLVPPDDAVALADALQWMAQDERVRESIGRAGRKRIQESFAALKIASEMSRLFSSTLDSALRQAS